MIVRRLLLGVGSIVAVAVLCQESGHAQTGSALNLMPSPASVQRGSGWLKIDGAFSVAVDGRTDGRLDRAVQRFATRLSQQTAIPSFARAASAAKATLVIHAGLPGKDVGELGEDESYTLDVSASGAKLDAPTTLGALHGLQTFLQLVDVSSEGFGAPAVTIQDRPRFPWRGLLIDVARHFIPLDVLKRNLDGMEAVKMNVFHWHLSENQGFRVESKKFPKLHQMGSDGLYYTQDEVRDFIAYAHDRGIRVVPEFDLPGHSTAWLVGYPEFASAPGPFEIERRWGIFDPAFDPTNEKAYTFLDGVIGEMAALFPDKSFHIGGDEVNGKQWDANARIQEFKRAHNLKTNEELQAYFSQRVQQLVTKHGKDTAGWDEIFVPGAPKEIMIQSWRGQKSLAAAAKQGYRGILSSGYYLDLGWTAARHYAVDPMSGEAASLSTEEKARILGGESCMWSEYVDAENIDSRIWPRNAAIAERLWSPQTVTDPASMYARMESVSQKLEWIGLTHRTYYPKMLQRIAGPATPDEFTALRTLTDLVEPTKDYTREQTAVVEPRSSTPLDRVVDAVPLESDAARQFGASVDTFLAASCRDAAVGSALRLQFARWRDNDAKVAPLAQRSFLVKEVTASSQDLSSLGTAGLAALDLVSAGQPGTDAWKTQQVTMLKAVAKAKAQLLLMPAPSVQKLTEAVAVGGRCAAAR